MRSLFSYICSLSLFYLGLQQIPYQDPSFYLDRALVVFLFFTFMGSLCLFKGEDYRTLFDLLFQRELREHAAQRLCGLLKTFWSLCLYGSFALVSMSTMELLYAVDDMARLGNTLAIVMLLPMYLLAIRWLLIEPLIQSLSKRTMI